MDKHWTDTCGCLRVGVGDSALGEHFGDISPILQTGICYANQSS